MGRPNSGYGIMNFLVLTPDGVGSTYLQRALTLYLNASGKAYYNTHEILNGLSLWNNILIKRHTANYNPYNQSLHEIETMLLGQEGNIISRIALYHIENRLAGKLPEPPMGVPVRPISVDMLERNKNEDYQGLYETCHHVFDKIIYCTRDPFEYALSWGIRNITGKFNVYTIKERMETHNDKNFNLEPPFFAEKLNDYKRYIYWIKDNFPEAIEVPYEVLHNDVDDVLKQLTESDFDIKEKWGTSLQEYNTLLYKLSLMYNPALEYSDKIMHYQQKLVDDHKVFMFGMPIKMNTLEDKTKKIVNFSECLAIYNTWAEASNEFPKILDNEISEKIAKENKIYELVD
jgi:hypothetical protein